MKAAKPLSTKVFIALLTATAFLVLLHLVLNFISIVGYGHQNGFLFELSNRFDVNDELSVPQWYSQLLFATIGVSSLLAAKLSIKLSLKRFWAAVGIVGTLLWVDDAAGLHEFILQTLHNLFYVDTASTFSINTWWLILPIVLLIAAGLAWWGWKVLPRRTLILFLIGGVVYVGGKVLSDSAANNVTDLFLQEGVAQGIEKVFQYTGASIVIYGIFEYLETNHGTSIKKAWASLKKS